MLAHQLAGPRLKRSARRFWKRSTFRRRPAPAAPLLACPRGTSYRVRRPLHARDSCGPPPVWLVVGSPPVDAMTTFNGYSYPIKRTRYVQGSTSLSPDYSRMVGPRSSRASSPAKEWPLRIMIPVGSAPRVPPLSRVDRGGQVPPEYHGSSPPHTTKPMGPPLVLQREAHHLDPPPRRVSHPLRPFGSLDVTDTCMAQAARQCGCTSAA